MASSGTVLATAVISLGLVSAENQISISLETPSLIPSIGFGTWNLDKSNASEAVSVALQAGFKNIDYAAIYGMRSRWVEESRQAWS